MARHRAKSACTSAPAFRVRHDPSPAVLSLSALRRLRFPLKPGARNDDKLNEAGRAVIAALGLYALAVSHDEGFWLRSRCELVAAGPAEIETVKADGAVEKTTLPNPNEAAQLLKAAANAAEKLGLNWRKSRS